MITNKQTILLLIVLKNVGINKVLELSLNGSLLKCLCYIMKKISGNAIMSVVVMKTQSTDRASYSM